MKSPARTLLVPLTAVVALAVAGCSSTTSGSASTGGASASGSGGSSSGGSPSSGNAASAGSSPVTSPASSTPSASASTEAPAATAEALASRLQSGLATTRSAHIGLSVTSAGQSVTGHGVERLSAGKLSALDLTETVPNAGELRIIQVAGRTYVKLPANLNHSGRPYALVTADSSDPTVRNLAKSLDSTQSSASAANAGILASAAGSVKTVGTANVGGVRTTHYSIVVDTAKLPATYPGRAALVQAGVTRLPVEIYLDRSNHPVKVSERFTASGQSVSTSILVTGYNRPVTITAPPARQVSTR